MKVKKLIDKTKSDKKIRAMSEKIKEEEKIKSQFYDERPFSYQFERPERSVGELTAAIEYHEYIVPTLKNIVNQKQENKKVIAEAKKEYDNKAKEPLQALKELEAIERDLFGGGGYSNHWITSRNSIYMGGKKPETSDTIASEIVGIANRELEREKNRLALIEERKKKEEALKEKKTKN